MIKSKLIGSILLLFVFVFYFAQETTSIENMDNIPSSADTVDIGYQMAPIKIFVPKKWEGDKKENPAYKIMKELWKRKKTNGLKKVNNYTYKEYEKIEFDLSNIDSSFMKKKIFKKKNLDFIFNHLDTTNLSEKAVLPVFFTESISNIIGSNSPAREKSNLVATKTSGLKQDEIVTNTVKGLYKEFNIYNNSINFFNKGFTSPASTNGFEVYEYNLVDTVDVNGVDCYRILYFPKRKDELTFKGDLYISKNNYSVIRATLQSSEGINVNFVKDIYTEIDYDMLNDSIFVPSRTNTLLDMSLLSKKENAMGIFARRTINFYDHNLDVSNSTLDSLYNEKWDPADHGAYEKDSLYWTENRPEELLEREQDIYSFVDTLVQHPIIGKAMNLASVFGSGYINYKNVIDFGNLYQSFGMNDVEGVRLRAGARTYFGPNDMWRVEGYGAYGFKDSQFKYGAEGRYMFNKFNRFTVGLGTKRDIEQLGASLSGEGGIMSRAGASSTLFSSGDNNFLSSLNKTNGFVSIEPWKNVEFRLDGTYQKIKSAYPEMFKIDYWKNGEKKSDLTDSHLTFTMLAKPGAKYSNTGLDRTVHSTLSPTIMLRYTKGFEGVAGSDFDYNKLQLMYYHPLYLGTIGRTDINAEVGKTFNPVPLSLLSTLPGNQSYFISAKTFSQLNYYEFVTDTYASIMVEHHFNGKLFSYIPLLKKSGLREVVFFRGAWGDLSKETIAMNASNIDYKAPKDHMYYEYGFGIENIGWGNIRVFRLDFNWRGNYLDMPGASKFSIKGGVQLSF